MKIFFNLITYILLLYFFELTKEDICPEEYISISGLGKCKKIIDISEDKNLVIKTENLFYLASNNEGKIEKNGYKLDIYKLNDTKLQSHNMKKSKLYIPNSCMKKMELDTLLQLDKNAGIVIIVHDSNNLNDNNITNNYFIIRQNNANSSINYISSKEYDFSFCNEDPIFLDDEINIEDLKYSNENSSDISNITNNTNITINIDKILYARKYGIDLFDRYSSFLKDICFKFKSEKGSDVTLESRVEDYFQNITFCDDKENSHYISYNYSANTGTFTYRCAFGFYTSEKNKSSYIDIIDTELKSLVAVSNLKVITCYNKILNIRDITRNYGGIICIFVLIIQIVCFLIFCFCGTKPIEEYLDDLFHLGRIIFKSLSRISELRIYGGRLPERNKSKKENKGKTPKKKFNLWGQIRRLKEKNLLKLKQNKTKEIKRKSNVKIAPRKIKDDESEDVKIKIVDINDDIFKNGEKVKKIKTKEEEKQSQKNTDGELSNNTKISKLDNSSKINFKDLEKKSENSQLYEYESDELNELPLNKAIKYDKRTFCEYLGNILLFSHIILNVLFLHNDYNLFVVKLGLLFMTFPINLTMNLFFFTNKKIELSYEMALDDLSSFLSNIGNTIYSSLLSNLLLILLKLICLTHKSVRSLRKMRDVGEAQKKSVCVLRCIKIRVTIYFLLSFFFLVIFGFYVLCFCTVFENTQIELIKSTFTSWLMSLLYPFIICFFTSLIRRFSFEWQSTCLYKVKQMMQML